MNLEAQRAAAWRVLIMRNYWVTMRIDKIARGRSMWHIVAPPRWFENNFGS